MLRGPLLFAACVLAATGASAQGLPTGVPWRVQIAPQVISALPATSASKLQVALALGTRVIRGQALSAHVRFLADDLLEGRGTGTRGYAIAARYVAATLQSIGVTPAGDNGGWFQSVPLRRGKLRVEKSELRVVDARGKAVKLTHDTDFIAGPPSGATRGDAAGPLAFGAFALTAPAYRYDDMPADVKGKIVIALFGAPGTFPSAARAVYSDFDEKSRRLASRGAVGVILVLSPAMLKQVGGGWAAFASSSRFHGAVWMDGDRPGKGGVLPGALIPPATLDKMLAAAGRSERAADLFARGEAGTLRSFDLPLRAKLHAEAELEPATSENVVGILRGSDPSRAGEYVAVTAHLDHLGIGPPINGDAIYNGADDNAEGIAEILEIARAAAQRPPARSLMFVACTGEEDFEQGSDYFARHPTVPLANIVADVNVDHGAGPAHEPHDMIAYGAEHSSIETNAKAVAATMGWELSPDPMPDLVYFIRSDQYSFVKRGIPSVLPMTGLLDAHGDATKNRATEDELTLRRYHKPADEWDPKRNWEWVAVETRAFYLLVDSIADSPSRPQWNPDDVFERMFPQPTR